MDFETVNKSLKEKPHFSAVLHDMVEYNIFSYGDPKRRIPRWSYIHDHSGRLSTQEKEEAITFLEHASFVTEYVGAAYPDGYPITFLRIEHGHLNEYRMWEQNLCHV